MNGVSSMLPPCDDIFISTFGGAAPTAGVVTTMHPTKNRRRAQTLFLEWADEADVDVMVDFKSMYSLVL
jgi:hypothetical protein